MSEQDNARQWLQNFGLDKATANEIRNDYAHALGFDNIKPQQTIVNYHEEHLRKSQYLRDLAKKLMGQQRVALKTTTNPQDKEGSAMNRFDFIVDGRKYAVQDEAMFLSMERVKKIADVEGSELGMRDKENPTKMKTLDDEDFVFPILDSLATPYVFFTI